MPKELACKKCRALTFGRVCPVCNSPELTPHWTGMILVYDTQRSRVAAILELHVPHKYALKAT
jgi:DNA-directed RNA polymerase subunit E"